MSKMWEEKPKPTFGHPDDEEEYRLAWEQAGEDQSSEGEVTSEAAGALPSGEGASAPTGEEGLEAPAPQLRSIREIIADLSKPISPRHIKTRKQGGTTISYIEWHAAVRYLNYYAPGWKNEIRRLEVVAGGKSSPRLIITIAIGIPALEGVCWRESTGFEFLDSDSYGDPSSNAEAMALKRAAAKFGLGLHLYEK